MKCIYCLREFERSAYYPKEHVFPKAFGCPDNWTLECVCAECNNLLGGGIEKYLAKDSIEGLIRHQRLGWRSKRSIQQRRLKLQIPKEPQYGKFQGAILYPDPKRRGYCYIPPQIGFQSENTGDYEFFTEEDLKDETKLQRIRKMVNSKKKVLAPTKQEHDQFISKLREKGINFTPLGEPFGLPEEISRDEQISLNIKSKIDDEIFRAMAKISFNYTAKVKGCNFVLNSSFNDIREYIIKGVSKGKNFVRVSKEPLLARGSRNRDFDGHIFIIERNINQFKLISKITLFNLFTYEVLLSEKVSPILYPIKIGHAYDIRRRVLRKLCHTRLVLPN